jgi:hypothetical protein
MNPEVPGASGQERRLHGISRLTMINLVGYVIASVIGLGAVLGTIATMYSAVSARTREIASCPNSSSVAPLTFAFNVTVALLVQGPI